MWENKGLYEFTQENGIVKKRRTKIPPKEFLPFNSVLEEGKVGVYYITFIVPERTGQRIYDKLEIEFIRPNNPSITVVLPDIDEKQWLLDEGVFEEILPENS